MRNRRSKWIDLNIALIQKLKVSRSRQGGMCREVEGLLIENNMTRDINLVSGKIETSVILVIGRIPKKDTSSRARGKFVGRCG